MECYERQLCIFTLDNYFFVSLINPSLPSIISPPFALSPLLFVYLIWTCVKSEHLILLHDWWIALLKSPYQRTLVQLYIHCDASTNHFKSVRRTAVMLSCMVSWFRSCKGGFPSPGEVVVPTDIFSNDFISSDNPCAVGAWNETRAYTSILLPNGGKE